MYSTATVKSCRLGRRRTNQVGIQSRAHAGRWGWAVPVIHRVHRLVVDDDDDLLAADAEA